MKILLIEDHEDIAANIGEYLEARGEVVDYAGDGLSGLHLATVNAYDALVLDVSLPGMDGFTLCQRLRQNLERTVPVLMLTARDTERDKLAGFEIGADDYLTKPFSLPELHARLKALHRRGSSTAADAVLRIHDLEFDTRRMAVRRSGKTLSLTPLGLRLLEKLMRAAPAVISRTDVEYALWGDDPPDSDANLRGHIYALRQAVDQGQNVKLVHTLHGIGYRIGPP